MGLGLTGGYLLCRDLTTYVCGLEYLVKMYKASICCLKVLPSYHPNIDAFSKKCSKNSFEFGPDHISNKVETKVAKRYIICTSVPLLSLA